MSTTGRPSMSCAGLGADDAASMVDVEHIMYGVGGITFAGVGSTSVRDERADRNRWFQAGLALEVTTAVVAKYVDGVFSVTHADVIASFPQGSVAAAAAAAAGPTLHSLKCNAKSSIAVGSPQVKHSTVVGGVPGCLDCESVVGSVQRKHLADDFAALHRKKSLERLCFSNVNATKWGTPGCHIEMAKLFCPKLGEHAHAILKTDFSKLDGTALFNMIHWCNAFDVSLQAPSAAATAARNRWGHEGAATLSLSQEFFDEVICGLRSLLDNLQAVAGDQHAFTQALQQISDIVSTQQLLLPISKLQKMVKRLTAGVDQTTGFDSIELPNEEQNSRRLSALYLSGSCIVREALQEVRCSLALLHDSQR
jgi:hypothetical protein